MKNIFMGLPDQPRVVLTGICPNSDVASFEGYAEYQPKTKGILGEPPKVYYWRAWPEANGYVVNVPGTRSPMYVGATFNLGLEVATALQYAV